MKTKTFNTPNELDEYFDINTKTLDLLQFDLVVFDFDFISSDRTILANRLIVNGKLVAKRIYALQYLEAKEVIAHKILVCPHRNIKSIYEFGKGIQDYMLDEVEKRYLTKVLKPFLISTYDIKIVIANDGKHRQLVIKIRSIDGIITDLNFPLLKDGQYEGVLNNIPFKPEDLGL